VGSTLVDHEAVGGVGLHIFGKGVFDLEVVGVELKKVGVRGGYAAHYDA
jgi:hypothetical protein